MTRAVVHELERVAWGKTRAVRRAWGEKKGTGTWGGEKMEVRSFVSMASFLADPSSNRGGTPRRLSYKTRSVEGKLR